MRKAKASRWNPFRTKNIVTWCRFGYTMIGIRGWEDVITAVG